MNIKESKVETVFFVENDRLIIQQGDEQTTFDAETTKRIHAMLTRKLFGKDAIIIKGIEKK